MTLSLLARFPPAVYRLSLIHIFLYLLTYHGVLCHQARDLFSAGSVANPNNDDEGGSYIERALKLIESEMKAAALRMDDALFVEYWGDSVRCV